MPKWGQRWEPAAFKRSLHLQPFGAILERLVERGSWPRVADFDALIEDERAMRSPEAPTVHFVATRPKPSRARRTQPVDVSTTYEGRIAVHGEVPCLNESYHDLFNAVAWAAFPRAKRAVHARQFQAMKRWLPDGTARIPNRRTREQDALTILDEGGVVLVATRRFLERIAASDPLATRIEGQECRLVLFGHALMEHVSFEESSIRSAALVVEVEAPLSSGRALLDVVDDAVTKALGDPNRFQAPGSDRLVLVAPNAAWT